MRGVGGPDPPAHASTLPTAPGVDAKGKPDPAPKFFENERTFDKFVTLDSGTR
jgi:hypothetical protein